jgi:hypothetical protein
LKTRLSFSARVMGGAILSQHGSAGPRGAAALRLTGTPFSCCREEAIGFCREVGGHAPTAALANPAGKRGVWVGTGFLEQTVTVMVGRHGAKITLLRMLVPDQEINIRCPRTAVESDARVVGQIGSEGEKHFYGVELLDEGVNLWGMILQPARVLANHTYFPGCISALKSARKLRIS